MLNFLGKRILQLIPTLFFVSILIFSLQHLLPGDPALVMAGEERDPGVIAQTVSCPGCSAALQRCAADPGPTGSRWIPGLHRIVPRCAAPGKRAVPC